MVSVSEHRSDRFTTPDLDPDYYVDDVVKDEVQRLQELVEAGSENLIIVGPSGTGKTVLAKQIAALRQSPTFIANSYTQRSPDEWFGREWVEDGKMFYEPAPFVDIIETEGATIIINDIALMQNRTIQNGLNDLLDYSLRLAHVDQITRARGEPIRVADKVLIIATHNEGSEYTGNIKLSANLMSRFPNRIYLGYPPADIQTVILSKRTGLDGEDCKRLVRYAEMLRASGDEIEAINIDMRGLIQAAKKMVLGANIYDAVTYSVVGGLPIDMQEKAYSALEPIYTEQEKEEVSLREESRNWGTWNEGS